MHKSSWANGLIRAVRLGKGDKDRVTVLPQSLREEVAKQIERARAVWRVDRDAGLAGVYLPGALARKFRRAAETFEWSCKGLCPTRFLLRHQLHGQVYNEAIKRAVA